MVYSVLQCTETHSRYLALRKFIVPQRALDSLERPVDLICISSNYDFVKLETVVNIAVCICHFFTPYLVTNYPFGYVRWLVWKWNLYLKVQDKRDTIRQPRFWSLLKPIEY